MKAFCFRLRCDWQKYEGKRFGFNLFFLLQLRRYDVINFPLKELRPRDVIISKSHFFLDFDFLDVYFSFSDCCYPFVQYVIMDGEFPRLTPASFLGFASGSGPDIVTPDIVTLMMTRLSWN